MGFERRILCASYVNSYPVGALCAGKGVVVSGWVAVVVGGGQSSGHVIYQE